MSFYQRKLGNPHYNENGNPITHVGNWYEERALVNSTGIRNSHLLKNRLNTEERIMAVKNGDKPREISYDTTYRSHFDQKAEAVPASLSVPAQKEARLMAEAEALYAVSRAQTQQDAAAEAHQHMFSHRSTINRRTILQPKSSTLLEFATLAPTSLNAERHITMHEPLPLSVGPPPYVALPADVDVSIGKRFVNRNANFSRPNTITSHPSSVVGPWSEERQHKNNTELTYVGKTGSGSSADDATLRANQMNVRDCIDPNEMNWDQMCVPVQF